MTGAAQSAGHEPAPSALHIDVFTSPTRTIGDSDRTFSPITSAIIFGERDAVLVDAQFISEDVDALGDRIETIGRTLQTIFITHGHGDHYFGADRLASRFPGAQIVATPAVASYIDSHIDSEIATWTALFADGLALPTSRPDPLATGSISLEGHELKIIELPRGDIAPCAVLHVPALDAVIAGDVAYNQIHQMLGLGGPDEWAAWIASVDVIKHLNPRIVVAGHKKPEADDTDVDAILDGTAKYIADFARAASSASTAADIIATMQAAYPDHGNLTTLIFSAGSVMRSAHRTAR